MGNEVAIITRTKDRAGLLKRCLKSVTDQSFTNYQHLILNNGGDDTAVEEAIDRTVSDRDRIKVIHSLHSLGMGGAINKGFASSDSKYIVVLDDDDTLHPNHLQEMVGRLKNKRIPSYGGAVCRTRIIHEKMVGDSASPVGYVDFNPDLSEILLVKLAVKNLFTLNAFLFERRCLDTVGFYREDLPVLEDWDFNLRFLLKYDLDVVPEILAYWHWRVAGQSTQTMTTGKGDHVAYTNHLRNQWLRDDISSGKPGLGVLMNLASVIQNLDHRMIERTQALSPFNKLVKKLLAR